MIASMVAGLVGWGIPKPLAQALLIALAAVALVGAFMLAKSAYDRDVVEDARLEGNAKALEQDAAADTNAAEGRLVDAVRANVEQTEIEEAVNEARDEGRDPRAAYYECVRLLQQARAAGRPAPTC